MSKTFDETVGDLQYELGWKLQDLCRAYECEIDDLKEQLSDLQDKYDDVKNELAEVINNV